jgi:hypothetical protein
MCDRDLAADLLLRCAKAAPSVPRLLGAFDEIVETVVPIEGHPATRPPGLEHGGGTLRSSQTRQ